MGQNAFSRAARFNMIMWKSCDGILKRIIDPKWSLGVLNLRKAPLAGYVKPLLVSKRVTTFKAALWSFLTKQRASVPLKEWRSCAFSLKRYRFCENLLRFLSFHRPCLFIEHQIRLMAVHLRNVASFQYLELWMLFTFLTKIIITVIILLKLNSYYNKF